MKWTTAFQVANKVANKIQKSIGFLLIPNVYRFHKVVKVAAICELITLLIPLKGLDARSARHSEKSLANVLMSLEAEYIFDH